MGPLALSLISIALTAVFLAVRMIRGAWRRRADAIAPVNPNLVPFLLYCTNHDSLTFASMDTIDLISFSPVLLNYYQVFSSLMPRPSMRLFSPQIEPVFCLTSGFGFYISRAFVSIIFFRVRGRTGALSARHGGN